MQSQSRLRQIRIASIEREVLRKAYTDPPGDPLNAGATLDYKVHLDDPNADELTYAGRGEWGKLFKLNPNFPGHDRLLAAVGLVLAIYLSLRAAALVLAMLLDAVGPLAGWVLFSFVLALFLLLCEVAESLSRWISKSVIRDALGQQPESPPHVLQWGQCLWQWFRPRRGRAETCSASLGDSCRQLELPFGGRRGAETRSASLGPGSPGAIQVAAAVPEASQAAAPSPPSPPTPPDKARSAASGEPTNRRG